MHWRSLILVVFVLAGCREPRPEAAPLSEKPRYAILTDSFSQSVPKPFFASSETTGALDRKQAEELIEKLPNLLKSNAEVRVNETASDFDEVLANLTSDQYLFQLVPFTLDGRLHVFVNALDKSVEIPGWRENFRSVLDGGPSFWFCVCDLERGKIILFHINGRA